MKFKKVFFFIANLFLVDSLAINNLKYNYDNLERQVSLEIPYKSLVKKIEDHSVSKIYFSKSLNNVISTDDNYLYSVTTITPLITNDLVDVSIKNDVDTVFFEVPPKNNIQTLAGNIVGFIESTFLPIICSFSSKPM
jgi:hypothetical protein